MSVPVYRDYSDEDSKEISVKAFQHMRRAERQGITVSYKESVLHVMHQSAQDKQSRRFQNAGDWADQSVMDADVAAWEAYHDLANLLLGLRRSLSESVVAVNGVVEPAVISAAARFVIQARQNQLVSNMAPGATNSNLRTALSRAMSDLPATGALYSAGDRAEMTPEAILEMFPSMKSFL